MTESSPQNVLIIGSGPAGLTAAIYLARANLKPILLAGVQFGGQLMTTTLVENYPGFSEGIQGPALMAEMIKQAERFGTEIKYETVQSVDFSKKPFVVKANDTTYTSKSVILATGSTARTLGLESEQKYWGKGVSTCATCDGAFYRDRKVAVIGGGDSAMEEANFLTRFAETVYIIHRRDAFRASKIMQERIFSNPKIKVVWNSEVREIVGNEQVVTGLALFNSLTGETTTLDVDGVFLAIGHVPQTEFLKDAVDLDVHGYVVTPDDVHTSVEGVFVAGDVSDPVYKQAITAAGMGCKAAIRAERYLSENL
ncbi:thioredoxin-disulfide reductase [candidate division WWE3 bacterium]|nr:thioredoxin-disulfide reductase [candidate division WWE3 bacterium]